MKREMGLAVNPRTGMLNALVNEQLIESRVMVCLITILSPRGPFVCTPVHIHAWN